MHDHIKSWINKLSNPHSELGGYSACPFAKSAVYEILQVNNENDIIPPSESFELIIYVLPQTLSEEELFEMVSNLKIKYPQYIFLPDHNQRSTFINGVQTNNGKFNLILCQWRRDLEDARNKLSKTKYYSFWDEEYLKEIKSA
jgi:hypothetical protein